MPILSKYVNELNNLNSKTPKNKRSAENMGKSEIGVKYCPTFKELKGIQTNTNNLRNTLIIRLATNCSTAKAYFNLLLENWVVQ